MGSDKPRPTGGEVYNLVRKMDTKLLLLAALGFAVVWGGNTAYKSYQNSRVQIRQAEIQSEEQQAVIEQLKHSSEQETKRLEIIKALVRKTSNPEAD